MLPTMKPTESQGRSGTLLNSFTMEGTRSATMVPSSEYMNMLKRTATTTTNHFGRSELVVGEGRGGEGAVLTWKPWILRAEVSVASPTT